MSEKSRKILYFTCQPVYAPGEPATGGGLRAYGIGQALQALGHDVIFSEPDRPAGSRPEINESRVSAICHTVQNISEITSRVNPDVVIMGNWGLVDNAPESPIPTVVDINGSLILENYYRRNTRLYQDMLGKIRALGKVDLVLAGSHSQKMYLLAWCLLAGMSPESISVEVLPFSLPPSMPDPEPPSEPVFVMAGYKWPWLEGQRIVETVSRELDRLQRGVLRIFSAEPRYFDLFPWENSHRDQRGVFEVAGLPRVEIHDPVSFDELTHILSRSTVALDVWQKNLERELALPARAVAYLWSGLPVITSKGGGLADWIESYGAGWTVDPEDMEGMARLVENIVKNPGILGSPRESAGRLAREQFTWDRTIGKLDRFCRSGWIRRNSSPLLGRLSDLESIQLELESSKLELESNKLELERNNSELQEVVDDLTERIGSLSDEAWLMGAVHRRPRGLEVLRSRTLLWNRTRRMFVGVPVLAYLLVLSRFGEVLSGLRDKWGLR